MSIHPDKQKTQEDANRSISEQETITQTMGPPTPPPQPPPQPPHGKRRQWLIVSTLIVVLVVVLALGSILVVQFARNPITQATPTPTVVITPTPTLAPAGPPAPISALWMSDASTGWARTTTHLILHTSNGGKNWQDVTPPYPSNMFVQLQPAFASLNGSTAWVAVCEQQQTDGTFPTVVFRTSDGGQHWQQAMLPLSHLGIKLIQFVNAQNGWVLSDFGGGAAGSQAIELFRSTDGGQTWSSVARTGSSPDAIPFNGHKSGMGWISATTGWITGYIARPNTTYLYRTQDGGMSWQPQSLPLSSSQTDITTYPPVFFSATEGLLPVSLGSVSAQSSTFVVYATHDGGNTWVSSAMSSAAAITWDFPTMQQGYVVGADGNTLYETSDGGQHWTQITPGANFRNINQLDFVSTHEGWAISSITATVPVLLKTTDGGHTWVQVS